MTSTIKVNKIEKESGSTLTLGGPGTAITLACGATQTGFGRTGTVDWQTSSVKTATFTAANGEGYFCNTAGGAFTMNLPAGSAGAIVSVQDYNNTFDTHNLTIDPNGSEKINGGDGGETLTLSTEGQGLTLVYIDGTVGWRSVHSDDFAQVPQAAEFVAASGGNTTLTVGDFKTHIFTADGPFNVTGAGNVAGSNVIEYLVVAGGGAGGPTSYGGGGGAGGFRMFTTAPGSNSPLNAPAGVTASVANLTITVGGGGTAPMSPGTTGTNQGNNSVFSTITSAGGGTGRAEAQKTCAAMDGGSGAGGSADGPTQYFGEGNTPPVSPPQGNNGGASKNAPFIFGGGGGGAGGVGAPGGCGPNPSKGVGGAGSYIADPFIGPTAPSYGTPGPESSTRYFGGGGGGGSNANTPYPGTPAPGTNGGGNGGVPGYPGQSGQVSGGQAGTSATSNTGSGGGGSGYGPAPVNAAGAGGSGIVMIRYKFQ